MKLERLLVVQLTEGDMAELLMLVESESLSKSHNATHWKKLLEKMREQINQQLDGKFFQCAACLVEKVS